jgi:flagellar L-ring protein precursor FlgH
MNRPEISLTCTGPLKWVRRGVCVVVLVFGETRQQALGQDASLLLAPPAAQQKGQLSLGNSSFMYRKLPPESEQRELQINDIVTVLVDYKSSMLSEGDANAKRTTSLNAVLSDWVKFDGKNLMSAPQTHGDPRIAGQLDSQFKTQSDMTLKDSLTFRIGTKVVDIRPNGNLVIEAHRDIQINDEVWTQSISGEVRRQSIGPDRTVRSDEVADLHVVKREKGFIRDSYNRGWFTKWYDYWKPF